MKRFLIITLSLIASCKPLYASSFADLEKLIQKTDTMGHIHMVGEFLDGDLMKITVVTEDMQTPVLGLAFHLKYEPEKLAFLKYEPGDFLERGGDPFYLVQVSSKANSIVFGETLRRDDAFPVGGGNVAHFYFQIIDGEEFNFQFETGVVSTLDVVRQDINNVNWDNLSLNRDEGNFVGNLTNQTLKTVRSKIGGNLVLNAIVAFAIAICIGLVIFFKRQEKKRLPDSVNFK